MTIHGVWAEDAGELHPEQWVNVYAIDAWGNAGFYCVCQVKDLDLEGDEYGLEPIDEQGQPVAVHQAMGRVAA